MLPNSRYKGSFDDDDYIKELLLKLPWAWRQPAANKYSEVYEAEGRRAANARLRKYVNMVNDR